VAAGALGLALWLSTQLTRGRRLRLGLTRHRRRTVRLDLGAWRLRPRAVQQGQLRLAQRLDFGQAGLALP
jgi:hypothetical protein